METPECLRCRHLLSAAMDGEATFNETEFVRKHLAGCPDCREAQQAYNSLRAQLRLLPTPEPPIALRMAIMSRINGRKAVYARRRPVAGVYSLLTPWQKGVFAAAVLALVFVSGFFLSMLLVGQPFEVAAQPVADIQDQKVVIVFTRPVDRNYIMANAPTLFAIKDAQNNPLQIDTANIVIDGNRVELPIKRESGQLQENEQIQVVVAPQIKDEKGAAVANPGPKVAVVAPQAPNAASDKTKPGQVVAVATTPVPPTSTTSTPTSAPPTSVPATQSNGNPTSTTAPPGTTAPPSTAAASPTVSTAAASTTAPVTTTAGATTTVSPTTVVTTTAGTSPTVAVTTTAGTPPTVPPTTPALPTVPATLPPTTKPPVPTTVFPTGTPVISATLPVTPSPVPETISPSATVGSPSASPSSSVADCKPVELGPGFEKLYLDAQARLGCPTSPPARSAFTYQVFQKGSMLYSQQTGRIYVFYNFGGWASYRAAGAVVVPTNTPATSATPGSVTPDPTGCGLKPRGSFGVLWSNNQAVQTTLGCPVDVDTSTSGGLSQNFSRGMMLYNPLAALPYLVIYNDGGFQAFPG